MRTDFVNGDDWDEDVVNGLAVELNAKLTFRGAWQLTSAYATNDLVNYGTSAYIASTDIEPSGEGPPYTPANELLWLNAGDLGSGDGVPIGAWASSGRDPLLLSQSNGGLQPILHQNVFAGKPAVRFDAGKCLNTTNTALDQQNNWCWVGLIQTSVSNGEGMVFMWGAEASAQRRALWASGSTGKLGFSGYNVNVLTNATTSAMSIATMVRSSGVISVLLNGTVANSGNVALAPYTYAGLGVGANFSGSEGWTGDMMELVSTANITSQERVEGYLAWKYGLQSLLPVTHEYASAAPLLINTPAVDSRWQLLAGG
jgi:hypothetical protein